MELLDVIDKQGNVTGITKSKREIHQMGEIHREAVAWIFNEENQLLLQKRAANKKNNPNKWGLTGGHVDAGESPLEGLLREVEEEIGLQCDKKEVELIGVYRFCEKRSNGEINNVIQYTYWIRTKKKIEEYILQGEEVAQVGYASLQEVERVLKQQDENYTFTNRKEQVQTIVAWIKQKIGGNFGRIN